MKDNIAEQTAAQGAEAHGNEGAAAVNLGKFKDVNALLNAYNSLEAEFTRRSQRLSELEERVRTGEASPVRTDAAFAESVQSAVEAYLSAHPPRIMAGGGSFAAAAPPRVNSLEEAGRLAREWMDQNAMQK